MSRNTRFATILFLAATPLAAIGAETSSMFKELDTNKDGQIDQSEARRSADVAGRFSSLDTNNDKQISMAEWQSGEKPRSSGVAGVSGESREPGAPQGQSPSGNPGEVRTPYTDK